jgi:hypothetical protein
MSLTFVAAFDLEAVKIIFSLNPLGGHDDLETRSEAHDRLRVDVGTEIVDERAVSTVGARGG